MFESDVEWMWSLRNYHEDSRKKAANGRLAEPGLGFHPIKHRLRDQAHPGRAAPEALGIDGRVFSDHEAFRDAHAAVDDDLLQPRRPTDLDARQQDRVLEAGTGVNVRAGEQQRPLDRRTGDDAAARQEGIGHLCPLAVVMDHFGRRGDLGIGPDRPVLVVQVKLRPGMREVDIGGPIGVQRAHIPPVGLGLAG